MYLFTLVDFEDLRTFHVLKYIGHYFMSALFAGKSFSFFTIAFSHYYHNKLTVNFVFILLVIAVLFTFYFWEIQDFTDRNILRTWYSFI